MFEYKGPERRNQASNEEDQLNHDASRLLIRIATEETPIDQIVVREKGEQLEKLKAAVRKKVAELFGYNPKPSSEQPDHYHSNDVKERAQPPLESETEFIQHGPISETKLVQLNPSIVATLFPPDKGSDTDLQKIAPESAVQTSEDGIIKLNDSSPDSDTELVNVPVKSTAGGEPASLKDTMNIVEEMQEEKMVRFKSDYDSWSNHMQLLCPWEELKSRLLANNGHYLELACNLKNNGVLFGIDGQGTPLFCDNSEEPIMTGMNYADTRNRVMFKYDGENMLIENGKPVLTGYEMFPYIEPSNKSMEIEMIEAFTGKSFIQPSSDEEQNGSWLESGENPSRPKIAVINPADGKVIIFDVRAQASKPKIGVFRLLRVKKV